MPGAGATSAVWFQQVRPFGKHLNVLLVDLPGHQMLDCASHNAEATYTLDRLINDLHTTVLSAGVPSSHVVALSLGTILARGWALRYPTQVRSAVLAGTIADLSPLASALLHAGWHVRHVVPYMVVYRSYAWIIMPGRTHAATRRLFTATLGFLAVQSSIGGSTWRRMFESIFTRSGTPSRHQPYTSWDQRIECS
jgi:pimeloyl-ACP methyl ester carboxylesterase